MKTTTALTNDARVSCCDGWTLHEFATVASTNREARRLPAWHAVRADLQSSGYGRTGRTWVSNEGGLWLSAVLPAPGDPARWSTLPLAAGWAVIEALACLGIEDLRLRWPNDILVGRRKLAGLLVERFHADTAVVGLGLNIFNEPAAIDPSLANRTIRLAELLPPGFTLDEITRLLLRALHHAQGLLEQNAFADIAAQITERWTLPARVALILDGEREPFIGTFSGIDSQGRLLLLSAGGATRSFNPAEVALLRELES